METEKRAAEALLIKGKIGFKKKLLLDWRDIL